MAGTPSVISALPAMSIIIKRYQTGIEISLDATFKEMAKKVDEMLQPENYSSYRQNCINAAKELCYESQRSKIRELFK